MELPGKRITRWREFKGLSTRQLSEMADIPYSTLKTIETNENAEKGKPSFEVLAKLRKAFPDLSIDWILDGTEPMLRGGVALTKQSMLPGGTLTESGATARKKGSRPHIDFEDANAAIEQGETIDASATQTDQEFRDMLISRIKALKEYAAKLEAKLEAKDEDNRKTHRVLERLQDSYALMEEELRELRAELRGKAVGSQQDAPGVSTDTQPRSRVGFDWYGVQTTEKASESECVVRQLLPYPSDEESTAAAA